MHQTTGNLTSRKDNIKGLTETFGYTDAGTYTYSSAKPHAVQSVSNTANFPLLTQNITYTPFNKPAPKPASNSERRKNW